MKRGIALLVAIVVCTACTAVYALYEVSNEGTWPRSWPKELEPLRKQARTLTGPEAQTPHYEIPFTGRAEFEAAWPYLLKVKTKGAPVILVRAPDARLGMEIKAGVRVWGATPSLPPMPEAPLGGVGMNPRERWMYTTFIELVVDGDVVDLNRIPLPADMPVIDERFKDGNAK